MLKICSARFLVFLALLLTIACLSGCGLSSGSDIPRTTQQHKVVLNWSPEPSIQGYYVYRGGQTGGPFTKISGLQTTASYTDNTASSGQTYFYVVTSLTNGNGESSYSNEVHAVIPMR
jgi:fibronectin type 3 domain-containing protein